MTEFGRLKQLISGALNLSELLMVEVILNCNCLYLARAFNNNSYNYRFSIPPGIHALDLAFTFYPLTLTLAGIELTVPVPLLYANGLQSYFISFIKHGDPNVERGAGTIEWSTFGNGKGIVDLTPAGFAQTTDNELPDDRCGFWQNAPYYS